MEIEGRTATVLKTDRRVAEAAGGEAGSDWDGRVLPPWAPGMLALVIAALSFVLYSSLSERERAHVQRLIGVEAKNLAQELNLALNARLRALDRMAQRWDNQQGTPRKVWEADAAAYIADQSGYTALAWLDRGQNSQWQVIGPARSATHEPTSVHWPIGAATLPARAPRIRVTPPRTTGGGEPYFHISIRLSSAAPHDGYLAGNFHPTRIVAPLVVDHEARGFLVRVDAADQRIYRSAAATAHRDDAADPIDGFDIEGIPWRIHIRPGERLQANLGTRLPGIVAIAGLLIAGLLALTLQQARLRQLKARDLARANQVLASEVARRAKAEAQRESYLTELERSNRELDDFAYIASHDLKEPLRGIHNYASFLLEDYEELLPADGRDKLHAVKRLTRRMEDLINALLHYSRLGRGQLEMQTVDMNALLAEVTESLHLDSHADSVAVHCPRPLPPVRGDRTRIAEVLQNLVGNAIKYNDSAEKRIEIDCLGVARQAAHGKMPSGHLLFRVADNGIGIRDKHLDSVFRIFKRLHRRDKYGGGTGAGLTIVRKVVERHNGSVWVESRHGEGSRFFFTLPAPENAPTDPPPAEIAGRAAPAEQTAPQAHRT